MEVEECGVGAPDGPVYQRDVAERLTLTAPVAHLPLDSCRHPVIGKCRVEVSTPVVDRSDVPKCRSLATPLIEAAVDGGGFAIMGES
jgi:hypothetical protein